MTRAMLTCARTGPLLTREFLSLRALPEPALSSVPDVRAERQASSPRPSLAGSSQGPLKRYRRRQIAHAIVTGLVVERGLDGHLSPAAQLPSERNGVSGDDIDDKP